MATNTYKCTVCKRQVERVENSYGIDIFAKCIITSGCRGKLRKTGRNMDNIRESFPKFEANLEDYTPRNSFAQHQQNIAAATWIVTHGLNCDPSVTVFVADANGKYAPLDNSSFEAKPVSRTVTKLTFSTPTSGIVHFNARSSSATVTTSAPSISGLTQVTSGGSFVFALPKYITKDTAGNSITMDLNDPIGDIKVEVVLEKPNQEQIWCFETLPGMLDVTPWTGISEVLVAKRRAYYLKTKNILNFTTFGNPDLTFADIPEGTRLRFVRIDYGTGVSQPIESKSLLVLLSAAPYEFTDKIRNKLLDLGELLSSGVYLTYSNGEFFVDTAVIEKTYPPIEAARKVGPVPPLPSPTPTPSVSPTISLTPTTTRTPTPTPTPTSTLTPTPTPSVTASAVPALQALHSWTFEPASLSSDAGYQVYEDHGYSATPRSIALVNEAVGAQFNAVTQGGIAGLQLVTDAAAFDYEGFALRVHPTPLPLQAELTDPDKMSYVCWIKFVRDEVTQDEYGDTYFESMLLSHDGTAANTPLQTRQRWGYPTPTDDLFTISYPSPEAELTPAMFADQIVCIVNTIDISANESKVYVNGTLVHSGTWDFSGIGSMYFIASTNGGPSYIPSSPANYTVFKFDIYDKVLSAGDITEVTDEFTVVPDPTPTPTPTVTPTAALVGAYWDADATVQYAGGSTTPKPGQLSDSDKTFTAYDDGVSGSTYSYTRAELARPVGGAETGLRYFEIEVLTHLAKESYYGLISNASGAQITPYGTGVILVDSLTGSSHVFGQNLGETITALSVGDVIGFLIDMATRKVWVSVNGSWKGVNPTDTGGWHPTGETGITLPADDYRPFAQFRHEFATDGSNFAKAKIRLYDSEFSNLPTGAVGWSES